MKENDVGGSGLGSRFSKDREPIDSLTGRYFGREIQIHHAGKDCFLDRLPCECINLNIYLSDHLLIMVLSTQLLYT